MSVPTAIGRFRVVRPLGAGGFATVWLAHDPELDAPVAVKLLADNWAQDADVRRRFLDEARLLRRVDSDHLVRVYDVGELPDGRPYFVMTYADRGSLAERLERHPAPWPPGDVLGVVDAIAAGLAVLHEHGVVHRDLKPRNVLLRSAPDGPERVLLGDLGIAKDLHWASGITMPAGSDGYMAPEQRGFSAQIGPATDVHALAVTAAQLLGVPGPPWPPGALGEVLAAGTAPDPSRRTPSAPAFAAALRGVLRPGAAPAPPPPPAPAPALAPPPPPAFPPPPPAPASSRAAAGDVTRVAASGGDTRVVPGGTTPPGHAPVLPAPPGSGRRIRRGPAVVAGAAVAAAALVGMGAWTVLTRPQEISAAGGQVRVEVPHGWSARSAVAFPGEDDTAAGTRASQGGRAVTVAYVAGARTAADVLGQVPVAGCTADAVRDTKVGPWSGTTVRYRDCPGGAVLDEVVLAQPAGTPWTVWLEVRSVGGSPDLPDVLSSLSVNPRG